jgi:hypothetical protein
MSFGKQTFGEGTFGWTFEQSEPEPPGDVLVYGFCGIDAGIVASAGGGHSGLHSIETGFVS